MFIGGPKVNAFRENLEQYLGVRHVIPCANGTDALQIALMALDLKPGDEVIVPTFTYVATAEVIGLLGLTPVMTDVDPDTFNITAAHIEAAITPAPKPLYRCICLAKVPTWNRLWPWLKNTICS